MSLSVLFWPLQQSYNVVLDHRRVLAQCQNPTGRLVAQWAKFMCIPQFVVAPLFACVGYPTTGLFFVARVAAMNIVGELDKKFPWTRCLGLCHLVTFGPLFVFMVVNDHWTWKSPTRPMVGGGGEDRVSATMALANAAFVWCEMRITAFCLFLDTRDLILHLCGYKYPCYVREAVVAKKLDIDDPRAHEPVNGWWSRLVGP